VRTLRAAIARELSAAEREYMVDGEQGMRSRMVYLRHEARFRCECFEGDHKQLSIEVLALRLVRPQRPWATLFIDQFSRLIVGWALSLQPTAAEVLAAIRTAVVDDPARPFGGVPLRLRWDHGREFGADAVAQAAAVFGCVSVSCEPYSPWQKGKIERLNRTLEDELLRGLPRWTGGPRDQAGNSSASHR
jgi:putative transposase